MGQAPATGRNSLRTLPRNFPGPFGHRGGRGVAVLPGDRRGLRAHRRDHRPAGLGCDSTGCAVPGARTCRTGRPSTRDAGGAAAARGGRPGRPVKRPQHLRHCRTSALPDAVEAPVLLKVGDNISTDEISPAGARALPFRSNIPKLAEFTFTQIDATYPRGRRGGRRRPGTSSSPARTTVRGPRVSTPRSPRATSACRR